MFDRLRSREQIPLLLNALGLKGLAVEIGVEWGQFSHHILRHWFGSVLYSVDPWMQQAPHAYRDRCNVHRQAQEARFRFTSEMLKTHGRRSCVLRMFSSQASRYFADATLDFVYIDGNHAFEAVLSDLWHWYPKLRPGGLLCGHDYVDGLGDAVYGVKSAVDLFFARAGRRVHLTLEPVARSWLVRI
jgi:hypothetical protein